MNIPLLTIAFISKYLSTWEVIGVTLSLLIYSAYRAKSPKSKELISLLLSIPFTLSTYHVSKSVIFPGFFLSSVSERKFKPLTRILYYTLLSTLFLYFYKNEFAASTIFVSLTVSTTLVLVEEVNDSVFAKIVAPPTIFLIFEIYSIQIGYLELLVAFFVALTLSYVAIKTKVADITGLLAAIITGVISAISSILLFLQLFLFFAIGSAATKYKYELKKLRGVAEARGGARGFENVFANTLPAIFFALNYKYTGDASYAVAFSASIATALGDTLASEIGQTAKKAYLITNFKEVKVGEDGAISPLGEIAAFMGCLIIAAISLNPIVLLAGFIGVHIDSLLGATLERRKILNNAGVNFLSTLFAGYLAFLLA